MNSQNSEPRPGSPVELVIGRVEHAMNSLNGLEELSMIEHIAKFDAAHSALTEALSSIDLGKVQ